MSADPTRFSDNGQLLDLMVDHLFIRLMGEITNARAESLLSELSAWAPGIALGHQASLNTVDLVVEGSNSWALIQDALNPDEKTVVGLNDFAYALRNLTSFGDLINKRVVTEFGPRSPEALSALTVIHYSDDDRLVSAALLSARGSVTELRHAVRLSHLDWRDLLVNGGLADSSWRRTRDKAWRRSPNSPATLKRSI